MRQERFRSIQSIYDCELLQIDTLKDFVSGSDACPTSVRRLNQLEGQWLNDGPLRFSSGQAMLCRLPRLTSMLEDGAPARITVPHGPLAGALQLCAFPKRQVSIQVPGLSSPEVALGSRYGILPRPPWP